MNYGVYGRPKLARNRYGYVKDSSTNSYGSTLFGNNSNANSVGGDMASLADFVGATSDTDGARGLVPAPLSGEQQHFLQGGGSWVDIPAYRWFHEWPGHGLEPSGLEIDGNLNVTDTLSTLNLRVEGAAHFWSLIIDEVKANGGQILVSPSLFEIDHVGSTYTYYVDKNNECYRGPDALEYPFTNLFNARPDIARIFQNVKYVRARRVFMNCDDGNKRIENECWVGDMMRCRTFNIRAGVYDNVSNKDYWTFVLAVGERRWSDTNSEHEAFYIDLAYAIRTKSDQYIPLGSTDLDLSGSSSLSFEYPPLYDPNTSVIELKKMTNDTLVGSRDVVEEYPDDEEFAHITEQVLLIRGIKGTVEYMTGTESEDGIDNSVETIHMSEITGLIMDGTMPTRNVNDSVQAILSGKGDEYYRNKPTELELDLAEDYSFAVLGMDDVPHNDELIDGDAEGHDDEDHDDPGQEGGAGGGGGSSTTQDPVDPTNPDLPSDPPDPAGDDDDDEEDPGTGGGNSGSGDNPSGGDDSGSGDTPTPTPTPNPNSDIKPVKDPKYFTDHDYTSDEYLKWTFGYGTFAPEAGDKLACLGHLFNPDRMNAIAISATNPIDPELEAPAIAQYKMIDVFGTSISKFRMTAIAKNGNEFLGAFLVDYNGAYFEINDRINMFMIDITTGLETVGIHLDGEHSTIRAVGSIELHQHDDGNDDTLSVWDSDERKKVEIIPREIPAKSDAGSRLPESGLWSSGYSSASFNASSAYITRKRHGLIDFWFLNVHWSYEMKDYPIRVSCGKSIGTLTAGQKLDLSNFKASVSSSCRLNGVHLITDRGQGTQQSVTGLWIRLKNGNTVVQEISRNSSGITVSGLESQTFTVLLNSTYVNDFTIPSDGEYSIEYEITAKLYCYGDVEDKYDNYFYNISTGTTGQTNYSILNPDGSSSGTNSGTMMTIGTNGMVFNVDNSKWFYAGEEGIELKWDDASVSLSNNRCDINYQTKYDGESSNNHNYFVGSNHVAAYFPNCRNKEIVMPTTFMEGGLLSVFCSPSCYLTFGSLSDTRLRVWDSSLNDFASRLYLYFNSAGSAGSSPSVCVVPSAFGSATFRYLGGVWFLVSYC